VVRGLDGSSSNVGLGTTGWVKMTERCSSSRFEPLVIFANVPTNDKTEVKEGHEFKGLDAQKDHHVSRIFSRLKARRPTRPRLEAVRVVKNAQRTLHSVPWMRKFNDPTTESPVNVDQRLDGDSRHDGLARSLAL
jgi:hypothetical protein